MHYCNIEKRLELLGLRKTKDRHKILELFEQDRTWTAAQVHNEFPAMDLSTVYRNLQKLESVGVISFVHTHDGEQHYEQTRAHHDHMVCNRCGVVQCIPCPIPTQKIHRLELLGSCPTCQFV